MTPAQIWSLRSRLEMAQEGFARLMGVSFVSINRWEGGLSQPGKRVQAMLQMLAQALTHHPAEVVISKLTGAADEEQRLRALVELSKEPTDD